MRLASTYTGQNLGFTKTITSQEAGDIVSLAETKNFCRITTSDDDTYINLLISAAEEMVLNYTAKTLRTTNYTFEYQVFGANIPLPYAPHTSVSEVRTKVDGVETVLDSDQYYITGQDNKTLNIIAPIYGGLEIDLVAGYGIANVPSSIKLAILKTVLTNYENRQDDAPEATYKLPNDARMLLKSYKKVLI